MITKNTTSRTLIIHSVPHFDALHVEHHREQIKALIEEGYRHLIFDFDRTEYLNSSALGMLVELYNSMKRVAGTFRLLNCNVEIRNLLHQTQLDKLLLPAEDNAEIATESESPHYDQLHGVM